MERTGYIRLEGHPAIPGGRSAGDGGGLERGRGSGQCLSQTEPLTLEEARSFAEQSHTAVATVNGRIRGLYILHPNNIGRCGRCQRELRCGGASRGEASGACLWRTVCAKRPSAASAACSSTRWWPATSGPGRFTSLGVRAHWHDSRRLLQQRRRLRGYVHLLSPDGLASSLNFVLDPSSPPQPPFLAVS